jgi:hypothetical protein
MHAPCQTAHGENAADFHGRRRCGGAAKAEIAEHFLPPIGAAASTCC